VPAYGPQNDVTLKMPAFEWVHVQLHQQKGMISLSPPTICNSALTGEALLTAYEESEDSENLECESCRSEKGYYAHQRDKLEKQ
ncbi:hypothetical protein, partial [Escherichia coli]|uniref:hypothetical protein n=1 Tax=Escherichia coli TaxID=562 RepID=UPI00396563F9